MSLQDLVAEVVHMLPPSVSHVLEEIAKEVDSHSGAISALETVASDVVTESPQAATPAPSEPSTSGEAEPVPSPDVIPPSPVGGETTGATREVGNPEQNTPFEEWLKS